MAPEARGHAAKVFACPDCDKTFSRREYVNRHSRLAHQGARPFLCEACDTSFARSDILKRHKTTCVVIKNQGAESNSPDGSPPGPAPKKRAVRRQSKPSPRISSSSSTDSPVPPRNVEEIDELEERPALAGPSSCTAIASALPFRASLIGTSYTADAPFAQYSLPFASTSGAPASASSSASATPFSVSPDAPSLSPGTASSNSTANSPQTPHNPTLEMPPVSAGVSLAPPPTAAMAASTLSTMYATAVSQPMSGAVGANQTLAPGLARGSSFTQDEILASEVLEDLLRSPSINRIGSPGGYFNQPIDEQPSTALATTPSWHGGKTLSTQENYSSSVIGGSGWEYGGVPIDPLNSIEFSPEAAALADYFNKGGVGGISALDLGFYTEPSLWDLSKLEEPSLHTERDQQFFLPAQQFCLGYLSPWNVPPLARLSQFAAKAADEFLPTVPVVHASSIKLSEAPKAMAFALTVVGAAYANDGQGFSNEMLVEKRVFLVRHFNKPDATDEERFAGLQSLLLYQLLGLFHRDQEQRLLANTFHAALILMVRELDLPNRIRQTRLQPVTPAMNNMDLELAWKAWVSLETRRRVTFICFLCDLETATNFQCAPLLPFSELNIDLPSHDRLWNAKSATEWRDSLQNDGPTVNFLHAVRALIAPTEPHAFSPDGLLLADLSRLSSFPLLILSRTLSFLKHKTEEAMKQVDPFRTLLGGFGILEGRESENRDVLVRIHRGRARLRSLPGGVKRGGGEGWFEDVMPTSAKSASAREANAAAEAANNAPRPPSMFDDVEEVDHTALFTDYNPNPPAFANVPAANAPMPQDPVPLYAKDDRSQTRIEKLATKRAKTLAEELPAGWMPNF